MITYAQYQSYRHEKTYTRCTARTEERKRYSDNRRNAEHHSDIYCCMEHNKSKYAYADKPAERILAPLALERIFSDSAASIPTISRQPSSPIVIPIYEK